MDFKLILEPIKIIPFRGISIVVLILLTLSLVALLLAPCLMPVNYDWVRHTTSESAAQGIADAWLARSGFLAFGLAVMALTLAQFQHWGRAAVVCHLFFGVMMVATAVFSDKPWDTQLPYDSFENDLHTFTSTAMGFGYAVGILAVILRRNPAQIKLIVFDWIAMLASLIPLLIFVAPEKAGLLQRVMFVIAYSWYGTQAFLVFIRQKEMVQRNMS